MIYTTALRMLPASVAGGSPVRAACSLEQTVLTARFEGYQRGHRRVWQTWHADCEPMQHLVSIHFRGSEL